MTSKELRATFSLASIFAFRMLGLFMILPVFALSARTLSGATPLLIGIALGIYGLTQAILQIPFGMLSDRYGRKNIITTGLLLFMIGSIIAALSHTMIGIIIGRALQGAGAVGSTIIALVADLTKESNRNKAMALIGMTIGISFGLAMIIGPIVHHNFGLAGIFWLTAGMAAAGLLMLHTSVPTPPKMIFHGDSEPIPQLLLSALKNRQLLRLDGGILLQHAILTASFLAFPLILAPHVLPAKSWHIYLPVLVTAFVATIPFILLAEKKERMKPIFLGGIVLILLAMISLSVFHEQLNTVVVGLLCFFTAFTLLEALLPSLVSKLAPAGGKGTAMGIYSSSQFLGIFLGGSIGGIVTQHFGSIGIFVFCGSLALLWLLFAISMQNPKATQHLSFALPTSNDEVLRALCKTLASQKGVIDVVAVKETGELYVKILRNQTDKNTLNKVISNVTTV